MKTILFLLYINANHFLAAHSFEGNVTVTAVADTVTAVADTVAVVADIASDVVGSAPADDDTASAVAVGTAVVEDIVVAVVERIGAAVEGIASAVVIEFAADCKRKMVEIHSDHSKESFPLPVGLTRHEGQTGCKERELHQRMPVVLQV